MRQSSHSHLYCFHSNALIPFINDDTINTYLGLTNSGPYGGIAYQPGVCGYKNYRTSVVKSYSDQTTGEVNYFPVSSVFISKQNLPIAYRTNHWKTQ